MHNRTAWDDYFTGSRTVIQSNEYRGRQTPSGTGIYVLNCLFRSITSSSSGGGIYCYNSVTYLLVESTSFFSCKTDGNGGAVYFYGSNSGQCVLHEVCGYDCCTTNSNSNQFVYIRVYNVISSKNYINYSSISRCVNANAWYTLCLGYGNICCPSVNFSMNKCLGQSYYCYPFYDSNSVTCSLTYSSFTDNIATHSSFIHFWTTGANCEIKSCNILRNTQNNLNSGGTFYVTVNLAIKDSCILENKATYIFYQYSSYTITLSNCTAGSTSNNGYLTIKNTVTKGFILALNHMSTLNCHSEYDSAGTLTPIIHTPSPSKKPKLCYTFRNCFDQSQISIIVSLLSVFLFNFIHLDPSIYPLY
jgi:hypothetical protein